MSSIFTKGFVSSLKKGRQLFHNVLKTKTQKVVAKVAKPDGALQQCKIARYPGQTRSLQIWRAILPRIYYNSLAAHLGRQAAWRAGRKAPLLAFFGLVVSQHVDQSEEEITSRIQDFLKTAVPYEQSLLDGVGKLSLTNFEFGSRIGQGCNAAVYEAKWKDNDKQSQDPEPESFDETAGVTMVLSNITDEMADIEDSGNETTPEASMNKNLSQNMTAIMEKPDEEIPTDGPVSGCSSGESDDAISPPDEISDTESDITVISWDSDEDEDFWREEGAPTMFSVEKDNSDSDSDISIISMESSDDEFDVIDDPDQSIQDNPDDTDQLIQDNPDDPDQLIQDDSDQSIQDDPSSMDHPSHRMPNLGEETHMQAVPMLKMSSQLNVMHSLVQEEGVEAGIHQDSEVDEYQSMNSSVLLDDGRTRPKLKYDLAIKMMFNYDIESNVTAITKSMEKEMVPSQVLTLNEQTGSLDKRKRDRAKRLPPHPNIVEMWGMFVDPVPCLSDGLVNYPAALPSRINPDGMGRNMTMFIVMKRYDVTLTEYLSVVNLTFRERIYLLVQLLEAVDHLYKHRISHRDIKTDNILLDTTKEGTPQLVLSDFGCCLADPRHGLMLPYYTDEIDKGGNRALMAPEIVCAEPGHFVKLDYRKADVWSVGAIAYEILGADNPFYSSNQGKLDSQRYCDTELPTLPDDIPQTVKIAVYSMLTRDPHQRPSARHVLNILYTSIWAPEDWRNGGVKVTRSNVTWWIVTMATELLLKQRFSTTDSVELLLMNLFIQNLKFRPIILALQELNMSVK